MSSRNVWQDIYGLRVYNTGTLSEGGVGADTASEFNTATADADAFIAGAIGVDTSKYAIPLLNHPTFSPGAMVINNRKAVGTSYRRTGNCLEYVQGSRVPTVTYEADATPKLLAVFCQLLFQGGVTEAATNPFLKTCIPYVSGDADVVACAALVRQMSLGGTDSHMIGGAIIKSLTISGEEGQPIKLSAEFTGYNMVSDFDFNAAANILEFDNSSCLLFQNSTATLEGDAMNIDKFELTITNNAVAKFYNTAHVTKYVLGDFTATGSFRMPWSIASIGGNTQLNNFTAGTDKLFRVYWGTGSNGTDGDVDILVNARYTDAVVEGEDEIVTTLPFEAAADGTHEAITVLVCDAVDRSI
jgi:hypothetical protein